jgi:hypothetical protein
MAKNAAWDSFMFEDLAEGKQRAVDRSSLEQNDIRNERFDLDYFDAEDWCGPRHFFWTPQEAALITFYRDPSKVELDEDNDYVFDDDFIGPIGDDEDGRANQALRQRIENVHDAIRAAQAQDPRELPQRIRREVYVEWCGIVGIDFPPSVAQKLEYFTNNLDALEAKMNQQPDTPDPTTDNTDTKKPKREPLAGPRAENNTLRILLAVLVVSKLVNHPKSELSRTLANWLETNKITQTNGNLIDMEMIEGRVSAAQELLSKSESGK